MKVFQRGCCVVPSETNLKSLNLTKVPEKNYCRHPCQNTALSHANCSNFFSFCSNPNMTTNALQAEIPTELMMAEASDTPQVGIDTFHFQTLANMISCGSLCHLKMFAFHHECIVLEDLRYRPLPHRKGVNPNSSMQLAVGKATGCGKDTGYAVEGLQVKSRIYGILPPSGSLFRLDQMKSIGFLTGRTYVRYFMVALF